MSVPWYEWRPVRQKLAAFGRAIQGVSPYGVVIEPDRARCPTGYCDFSRREIAVNPTCFRLEPRDAYRATQALLVHEAGHRRFTTPARLSGPVAFVSNLLEDQRIETLMADQFAGLRPLVAYLAGLMYKRVRPVDPGSDDPVEVLGYILGLRWPTRLGKPVVGALSPRNRARWERMRPWVERAWHAESSVIVDRCAEEIVRLLGLRDIPRWMRELQAPFGRIVGKRAKGDEAERCVLASGTPGESGVPMDPGLPPLPDDHPEGKGKHAIAPAPYMALVRRLEPLVRELVEELSFEQALAEPVPCSRGTRLSIRQAIRTPGTPFLAAEEGVRAPPTLTFRLLVDHSTSMNWGQRMRYAREGAMLMHLVAVELGVPHAIAVVPNDVRIADLESGERGLALIAGLRGATAWEDIGLGIGTHGREMLQRKEDIKLVLCIHDGMPNDAELAREECGRLRGRVEVIGLGLDLDEGCELRMRRIFGPDRLILCRTPQGLPRKLGNLLRAIYGR